MHPEKLCSQIVRGRKEQEESVKERGWRWDKEGLCAQRSPRSGDGCRLEEEVEMLLVVP